MYSQLPQAKVLVKNWLSQIDEKSSNLGYDNSVFAHFQNAMKKNAFFRRRR